MLYRRRRFAVLITLALTAFGGLGLNFWHSRPPLPVINGAASSLATGDLQHAIAAKPDTTLAGNILETLPVKGRAPKTGYKRTQFGNGWADLGNCDTRNYILARDLTDVTYHSEADCTVLSGILLSDPYTGKTIHFTRGTNSSVIQIDHVVALSDAWQKGAQQLNADQRKQLANDPLELLAVDGPANNQKGDGDAATWLPSNKEYRCRYVARQIAVKKKYNLWVTTAERDAMRRILATCPEQVLPAVQAP
jgi:hypothetical protein